MAIYKILTYPEKPLLQKSIAINNIDEKIKLLIDDMGETMFAAPGVGLAAPQIGINKRVIVYDTNAGNTNSGNTNSGNTNSENTNEDDEKEIKHEFQALINPEIIEASGSIVSSEEGCLSILDYKSDVKRYENITIRALNIEEKKLEFNVKGIHAIIMQHEIDHLDGILFIDRISVLKRNMYKKKMKKCLKTNKDK